MDLRSDDSKDLDWRNSNYKNNNYIHGYNLHKNHSQHMPMEGGDSQIHVALHHINGKRVAKRIIEAIEAGDLLEGFVLSPSKEVYVPSKEIYELSLCNMENCCNKVLQWPRELVKELAHSADFGEQFVQQEPPIWSLGSTQNGFTPHTMSFIGSMEEVRGNKVLGRPYCHELGHNVGQEVFCHWKALNRKIVIGLCCFGPKKSSVCQQCL